MDSFGTHLGDKFIRIVIRQVLVFFWQSLQNVEVFFFRQQVSEILTLIDSCPGLNDDKPFIINDRFQFLGTYAEQITDLIWQVI